MSISNTVLHDGRKANVALDIVLVGCGLGGLAAAFCLCQAGHKLGADIQTTPSLTRLLIRWGLDAVLKEITLKPEALAFHRCHTRERVAYTKWARVIAVDPTIPTVTLMSGEVIKTGLIVGADGIKSLDREVVVGGPDKPVPTGDAVYRSIISIEPMIKDPLLKPLHVMAYNIRGKKGYNLAMIHPDDSSIESWTAEGSADKMRSHFIDWEPRVTKLLGFPYRAQRSAMAIELDGAVIGNLFSRLTDRSKVSALLHAYQALRHPRASATQVSARLNQKTFHYHDGPEQEARDTSMRADMQAELD
ncbi:hypothetical protein NEOLEDRAFT_1154177 [Neolentinus lepideus HHB14362 ss-1]|uniref:FAD/NAD(P)-binding domain-containing protein n=1 Tax=Neolentinus lepideus HHB14362 ss-1 TaxID=1314782 RepID=A0A165V4S8_9AGAM|nr:hypothetical protein NEOLEDRAFT_1154177 [Neolentinus lepideus HHB14362 ss-1]